MEDEAKKNQMAFIPMTSVSSGKGREVRSDVYYYTNQIVNIAMVGDPAGGDWVLVDAGMPKSAKEIRKVAAKRFGEGSVPAAIVLTHGHFDHVGSLTDLLKEWDVPVFAHPMEHPYLQGELPYPEPDPSVAGGGLLAKISAMYPVDPIDIRPLVNPLPDDYTVPGMPGWVWIHTPGHSPGHVSYYRISDRTLIAGDAFVTVKQDSFYKVLLQQDEVNGPPNYLTTDWQSAWESVRELEMLKPQLAICGHGSAMEGDKLSDGLHRLARDFEKIIPEHGKYVEK